MYCSTYSFSLGLTEFLPVFCRSFSFLTTVSMKEHISGRSPDRITAACTVHTHIHTFTVDNGKPLMTNKCMVCVRLGSYDEGVYV